MNTKLTLTIDETLLEKANRFADEKGRSLSRIIEDYLYAVMKDEPNRNADYSPIVKSLKGSFKAPSDFDYTQELNKALSEKYLQNG